MRVGPLRDAHVGSAHQQKSPTSFEIGLSLY
jgi:hypothetical protein